MTRQRLPVAALYLRISDDRTGREAGVTRQGEDCRALAAHNRYEIRDTYVDNDLSASDGKFRPAYERLLDDMRADLIDVVVTWHPDRLYRRPDTLEELVTIIENHRVEIKTIRAGRVDLTTPSGRLAARNMAAVNKYLVEHNAENWQRAVISNRKAGKWSNARDRLFGFERDGVHREDEAKRVVWIAEQVLAGRSLVGIATELNDEGVTTTRGNRWGPHAVRYLLLNAKIAGLATHKGEVVGKGQWEGILEVDKWEQVVAALHPYRARGPAKAILTRVVFCQCGSMMHSGVRAKGGHSTRIYRCPSNPPYDTGCGSLTIAAEPLEAYVEGFAKQRLDDPRVLAGLKARRADAGKIAELDRQIAALERRYIEISDELRDAKGRTAGVIVAALAEVERDLEQARARLAKTFPALAPSLDRGWPVDVESRNALIRLAVTRVVVGPGTGGRGFRPDRVTIEAA